VVVVAAVLVFVLVVLVMVVLVGVVVATAVFGRVVEFTFNVVLVAVVKAVLHAAVDVVQLTLDSGSHALDPGGRARAQL